MTSIDLLWVSQEVLRRPEDIAAMVLFVQKGGIWTDSSMCRFDPLSKHKLIELVQFPDGNTMIHDGHHRVVATLLAGRNELYCEEYVLKHRTYEEYLDINFRVPWITPFDPRTETRLPDFKTYKEHVLKMLRRSERRYLADDAENNWHYAQSAIDYIRNNKRQYARRRSILTVAQLVESFQWAESEK